MVSFGLLLRWSWRDLRAHWVKVVAIALIIGIGAGGYAGLSSNANWRRVTYATNYELLDMYDIRIKAITGTSFEEGTLAATAASIEHADWIDAVEERLLVPTQVEAGEGANTVIVRGEITGSDFSDGRPAVNGYHAFTGRLLDAGDAGEPAVMLEHNFARFYELPADGTLRISGDRQLAYVGQATTPEYFAVAPEGELFLGEASFAAVFTTLETAQQLADLSGSVNDAVITIVPEADRDVVVTELEDALAAATVGADVRTRDDNLAYSTLTRDVENDQQMFNVLAFLLFAGAVGAAFNLIHRLAEQQRREIGIAMAIGTPPWQIALRPMLVSAQIALLGVVFGVFVGYLLAAGMGAVLESFLPLPIWLTEFQTGLFIWAAIIGFLVPFIATAFPIWRAVRVSPIEAIRPMHLTRANAKAPRFRGFAGKTLSVMPLRNLARNPRRTVFTILGIAAIIAVMVLFLGVLDSFVGSIDTAQAESAGNTPNRVVVSLDGFHPMESPQVAAIAAAETVAAAEPTLRLGASLASDSMRFDVLVEIQDLDSELWSPTITAGSIDSGPGLVIAEEAAKDLDVAVGDQIAIRIPQLGPEGEITFAEADVAVIALHPQPLRTYVYVDQSHAALVGLAGITNTINVEPVPGATVGEVQRDLFAVDAVASAQSVTAAAEALQDQMSAFIGILQIIMIGVLALALLIAFNTASINLDARAREHATMFAYGVRVRTALRMAVTESLIIGVLATIVGVVVGVGLLIWMTEALFADTLPEFGITVAYEPISIFIIGVLGVLAVALAPLFTARRMRRMDLPGTLRLME